MRHHDERREDEGRYRYSSRRNEGRNRYRSDEWDEPNTRSNRSRHFYDSQHREGSPRYGSYGYNAGSSDYDEDYGDQDYSSQRDFYDSDTSDSERFGGSSYGGGRYSSDTRDYGIDYGEGRGSSSVYPGGHRFGNRFGRDEDSNRFRSDRSSYGSSSGSTYGAGRSREHQSNDLDRYGSSQRFGQYSRGGVYDSNFGSSDSSTEDYSGQSGPSAYGSYRRGSSNGGFYGEDRDQFQSKRGVGPKGYRRRKESIEEDVNEALTDHPQIDASEIEVRVDDSGIVTLSGTCDSRSTKRTCEDALDDISGVKDVKNEIQVKSRNSDSNQSDSEQNNIKVNTSQSKNK